MKIRSLVGVSVAGVLMFAFVPSASAADTGDTIATFTITDGPLAITVQGAASLTGYTNIIGGGTTSGSLGAVQVSDARSAATGWVASVVSTNFTKDLVTPIAATGVGYTVGTFTPGAGAANYAASNRANLSSEVAVVTATLTTGNDSVTWTPTISVAVPGGAAAGVYTATITHSVL